MSLFFGLEATSPWPSSLPRGKLILEQHRHATLAFLGAVDWEKLAEVLDSIPSHPFRAGLAGAFDKNLFLPKRHPNVTCWHVDFFDALEPLEKYQKSLNHWLKASGFSPDHREQNWLPHVTLARQPFDLESWKKHFAPLPVLFKFMHLYQSIGNSEYNKLWSLQLPLPWNEIEHTADIAFQIRGETLQQVYRHALLALAFKFPPLLLYLPTSSELFTLDDIVILLNEAIALADQKVGCPLKAVSFHGEIEKLNDILCWEMIVDV